MKFLFLFLLSVSAFAGTDIIKDPINDYYMTVNSDGSINTDTSITGGTLVCTQPTASLLNSTVVGPSGVLLSTSANQALQLIQETTTASAQGAGGTGITEPAGGSGILGWLSGIYKAITGTLTFALVDGQKTTYVAAYDSLVPAATATDIFVLSGSATKLVKVIYISVSATKTTSSSVPLLIIKRSTPDTGGTFIDAVTGPLDSSNSAYTAIAAGYSANPTLGALAAYVRVGTQIVNPQSTTDAFTTVVYTFGYLPGEQAPTLRGTNQQLAINLGGTTVAGGSYYITMEWTEE